MSAQDPLMRAVTAAVVDGKDADWINAELIAPAPLSEDHRAALWLFAFALSDPETRRRRAPAILGETRPSTVTSSGN